MPYLYAREFPGFSIPEVERILSAGFVDASWHNDACPKFTFGEWILWVDYIDPEERSPDCGRFVLHQYGHEPVYYGEELDEVLAFVNQI